MELARFLEWTLGMEAGIVEGSNWLTISKGLRTCSAATAIPLCSRSWVYVFYLDRWKTVVWTIGRVASRKARKEIVSVWKDACRKVSSNFQVSVETEIANASNRDWRRSGSAQALDIDSQRLARKIESESQFQRRFFPQGYRDPFFSPTSRLFSSFQKPQNDICGRVICWRVRFWFGKSTSTARSSGQGLSLEICE